MSRLLPTSSNEVVSGDQNRTEWKENPRHPDTPFPQWFCVSQHAWLNAYGSGTEEWEVEEFYWRFCDTGEGGDGKGSPLPIFTPWGLF